ncbi:MAG: GLPGLI family protein, partial [Bacteroidota bacterium]
ASTSEAWFSAQLPIQNGPEEIQGLPGMILELSLKDGKVVYTASNIELKGLTEKIEKPKKGKKISKEEFKEIVDERMKEMNGGATGGPIRVIQIKN